MTHNPKPESGGIPADVLEMARDLADDVLRAAGSGLQYYEAYTKPKIVEAAAIGLLRERERAALVVANSRGDGLDRATRAVLVDAIRRPHLTTPTREDA